MNKMEYLNALKEALRDIDQTVMDEIIYDYEEHFQIGLENGKSEEQICEDLGSIEDLVKEIREDYNAEKAASSKDQEENDTQEQTGNKKSKEWYFNFNNIDGDKICNTINSALDTAGEAISSIDVKEIGNTLKTTLNQAASSIHSFADSYMKNQGTAYSDSNKRNAKGYTENVSMSFNTDFVQPEKTKDVQESTNKEPVALNIFIDGICAKVNVKKSSDDKIYIHYENNGDEKQRQRYEFYSYQEGNNVYAGIRRIGKAVFINRCSNNILIEAVLPEHMGEVNIMTASGNIAMVNIKAENIAAETASGDISVNTIASKMARIKSSSGDIEIKEVNSMQFSAITVSGKIDLDTIETKEFVLKSSSGDVAAKNLAADIMDTGSLSGALTILNCKTGDCKCKTTSGDIKLDEFSINNGDISSVSGDLKLYNVIGEGLRATSTSGDVEVESGVKRCHASSKSGDADIKCLGDQTLEASSISGQVKVRLKNNGNGYSINATTTSGELYIDYNDIHQKNLKSGTYTYGSQGSELNLSTVSGDIQVCD